MDAENARLTIFNSELPEPRHAHTDSLPVVDLERLSPVDIVPVVPLVRVKVRQQAVERVRPELLRRVHLGAGRVEVSTRRSTKKKERREARL